MKSRLTFIAILLSIFHTIAQSPPGTGPRQNSYRKEVHIKKQQRREHRAKRKRERAEMKAVKAHHKRIQTKQVRKRMKAGKKTALRYNDNKRDFFLKRWFKKRSKPKTRSVKKSDTI